MPDADGTGLLKLGSALYVAIRTILNGINGGLHDGLENVIVFIVLLDQEESCDRQLVLEESPQPMRSHGFGPIAVRFP